MSLSDADFNYDDPETRLTEVKTVLANIDAVIKKRATLDQQSYTLNGRSLSRIPIPELLVLRDKYLSEYNNIKAAYKVSQGIGNGRKVLVRFD